MEELELGEVQLEFAELLWKTVPVPSGELVKMCKEEFGWKKPTTYTVLRKLCEKGIFKNENGKVEEVISRDEFNARKCERFVQETYGGSLPSFVASFASHKQLTAAEIEEIQKIIDQHKEARNNG